MQFERRKLADLHPAEYNPRKKLTPEDPEYIQIRNSLNEFGYADPIVINAGPGGPDPAAGYSPGGHRR